MKGQIRRATHQARTDLTLWMVDKKSKGENISMVEAMAFAKEKGHTMAPVTLSTIAGTLGIVMSQRRKGARHEKSNLRRTRCMAWCVRAMYEHFGYKDFPPMLTRLCAGDSLEGLSIRDAYIPGHKGQITDGPIDDVKED